MVDWKNGGFLRTGTRASGLTDEVPNTLGALNVNHAKRIIQIRRMLEGCRLSIIR